MLGSNSRRSGESVVSPEEEQIRLRCTTRLINAITTGAITAEKLEGTSRGVDVIPLPFPAPSLPTAPMFHPFPSHAHLSFSPYGGLACLPQCPAKK